MAGAATLHLGSDHAARFESKQATRETPLVKWTILAIALGFFTLFLLMPLLAVFVEAFRKGWETYCDGTGRSGRPVGDQADAAGSGDLGTAQPRLSAWRRPGPSPSSSSPASRY
jgi:ABC-type Fe3+ transport system permease subunit